MKCVHFEIGITSWAREGPASNLVEKEGRIARLLSRDEGVLVMALITPKA